MNRESRFQYTMAESLHAVADAINRPHEDYPRRVLITRDMITYHVRLWSSTGVVINTAMVKAIHAVVMPDDVHPGVYRRIPVTIDNQAIPHETIPESMGRIMGAVQDIMHLQAWYESFQRIHPFTDGNGRVGGIILAAASYHISGLFVYHAQPDSSAGMLDR